MTPNEFKNLPIPYVYMDAEAFSTYANEFKGKESIETITNNHDNRILKEILGLSDDDIRMLQRIKEILYQKRISR